MTISLKELISSPQTAASTASAVAATKLGSASDNDLQRIHNLTRSAGHLDGGTLTDGGGGNVAISSGIGFIRAINDDTSTLYQFEWSSASIAVPSNTLRYAYVDYNSGTPTVFLSASDAFDYRTQFCLGFIVNEGGTLFINDTPHSVGRSIGRILRRNYEVEGRSRAHQLGGFAISNPSGLKIDVSTGVTWFRGVRDLFSGIDTAAAGTFDRYYRDGASGWTKQVSQTDIDPSYYDNGTGSLQNLTNNRWSSQWIYLGSSNGIIVLYGWAQFNNQAACLDNDTPPASLPLRLQEGGLLLGRAICIKNATTVSLVQSAFSSSLSGSVVTNHNDLSSIQGGTADEYFHLTNDQLAVVSNAGTAASKNIHVGTSAPGSPAVGDIWVDTN